jgi:hypothetical protein
MTALRLLSILTHKHVRALPSCGCNRPMRGLQTVLAVHGIQTTWSTSREALITTRSGYPISASEGHRMLDSILESEMAKAHKVLAFGTFRHALLQ